METFELDNAQRKLKINTFRTYFDSGSFEYNQSGMDDKMQKMAKLLYLKLDFKLIFVQYRDSYYREGYMHIHRNAIRTLIEQISYLLYGNNYQPEVVFKARKMSDDEILEWYIQVIREKVAPQFTLQRLILTYLDHKFKTRVKSTKNLVAFLTLILIKTSTKFCMNEL